MPRLLIVKTSSLGDVVHNLPVVSDIRARFPTMEIHWAVEENFAEIPALHPAVSDVIPVAIRRWRKSLFTPDTREEIAECKLHLQNAPYDYILDTQGLVKSALVTKLAIGSSHGYDWASAREPLASLFYTHRHTVARGQHAVARNRQLASKALGYPSPITPPDYGIRPSNKPGAMSLPDLPEKYIVGLHGTSRDSKLWPVDYWAILGHALASHGYTLLLPWGTETELRRAMDIAEITPKTVVLPPLRLQQLAGVLDRANAAVGVDTGLIHLAVALDVPTLAIYTDTNPALTGVYGAKPEYAVSLGGKDTIPSSEAVISELEKLLGER